MAQSSYSYTEPSNRNRNSTKRAGLVEAGKLPITSSQSSVLTPIAEDEVSQPDSQSADDAMFHILMKEYNETRRRLLKIEGNLRELIWKRLKDRTQVASPEVSDTTRSQDAQRTDQSSAESWLSQPDSPFDFETRQEGVSIFDLSKEYEQRKRERKRARNINRVFARENP